MRRDGWGRRDVVKALGALAALGCVGCERPAPSTPPGRTLSAEEQAEDLEAFRAGFVERDAALRRHAYPEALARWTALRDRGGPLGAARFELALAAIAALARNGHSSLLNPGWTARFNRLPLRFLLRADGLFVGAWDDAPAGSAGGDPPAGSRVLSIGGSTPDDHAATWARHHGGHAGWRNEFLPYFLESPEVLHAAGATPRPDRVAIEVELPAGGRRSVTVEARDDLPPLVGIEALIPPPRELLLARDRPDPPLFLRQPDRPFRFLRLEGLDAAYIQFRANADFTGDADAAAFAAEVEDSMRADPPAHVVLDQRHNWGGDLTTTRGLMQALPDCTRPGGRVAILTSGRTFSAGIASAAYAKQAAGARAIVFGEPVGDGLEFWAEGELLELPRSGAALLYALERHDYRTGCPEPECHEQIRLHPIRIDTLQPDVSVAPTWRDFAEGRDPVLDAVRAHLAV